MAKYAISPQGVQSFQSLAESLNSTMDNIKAANKSLQTNVESVMDSTGIYGLEIWNVTLKIGDTLSDGEESVNALIGAINKQIGEIEQLFGLGGGASGGGIGGGGGTSKNGLGNTCEEKLGKEFINGMNSVISKSSHNDVKNIYSKYANSLTVADSNHKGGAFYRHGEGVYLDKNVVSSGDVIHKPYQTAFHEFGHNIDYLMGGGNPISESYGNGMLLDAIKNDFKDLKGTLTNEKLVAKLRGQANKEGWSMMDVASVSDMLECLTGIDFPLGAGHGADYWINPIRLPCKEFFF